MNYATAQEPLRLREYGRNVQKMAELVQAEPDPEQRYRMAQELVRIMGLLTVKTKDPRELAEQRKKLWEHLYRVCNFELELPQVENPPQDPATQDPPRVAYYPYRSRYRQYGKNIELMIEQALAMPTGPARERYVLQIANIMKLFLTSYSGATNDQIVFEHLATLSGGRIRLSPEAVTLRSVPPPPTGKQPTNHPKPAGSGSKKRKKKHKKPAPNA